MFSYSTIDICSVYMHIFKRAITSSKSQSDGSYRVSHYSKTGLKRPLKKKIKLWFAIPIIAYCRSKVLQNAEHSAILSSCIKLPVVFKTFVLSIFE